MRRLAAIIAPDAHGLADLETTYNGKVLCEMANQVRAVHEWFYYCAELADKITGRTLGPARMDQFVYTPTRKELVGAVEVFVPWNSPLLLISCKIARAIAAGCAVVLKPSDLAAVTALELARPFAEAGFTPGVLDVVTGVGPAVRQRRSRASRTSTSRVSPAGRASASRSERAASATWRVCRSG